MREETVNIDKRFGEQFEGEYVFQEISWVRRSRIIQKHTKYHEITGKVIESDYVTIQAETICASLKTQPKNNPVTLELILDETKGFPIRLGELFSKVVNKLNSVSGKDSLFLLGDLEEEPETQK